MKNNDISITIQVVIANKLAPKYKKLENNFLSQKLFS